MNTTSKNERMKSMSNLIYEKEIFMESESR
jgi:hypothetical protein